MIVQLELWQLITLLLAFFSAVGFFGRILIAQFEKRQAEQAAHWDQRFTQLENGTKEVARIERDFLEWKSTMPMTYVLRDDYVRNQTVIEAKLDSVMLRIENLQLKGVVK